jgi:hypothetical protein
MVGRVKGDTLNRIWRTFRARGHVEIVAPLLRSDVVADLDAGHILANEWYPIEHYLALYGTLREKKGHDEAIATARASVLSGLTEGSWRAFVPVMAGLLPDTFCQRGIKRFGLVYKVTFEPGEADVTAHSGGAEIVIHQTPWAGNLAWRAGVTGGMLAVPAMASLEATCEAHDAGVGSARFTLSWQKK